MPGRCAGKGQGMTHECDLASFGPAGVGLERGGGAGVDRTQREELLAVLVALPRGDERYARVQEQCVRAFQPLVIGLAQRFFGRGEPLEDLIQVANVGLLTALERFDPVKGSRFEAYAVPTIVGEIKRHFRDRGWVVRVSRRLQELKLALNAAREKLVQLHGRAPTVAELAAFLDIGEEEVLEGLEASRAYATWSLDGGPGEEEEGGVREVGETDAGLGLVEDREVLKPLLEELPERERGILLMRFYGNMTQNQIAERIGVSQMHVSRLLTQTLGRLKQQMQAGY
jgi:RNA polymerase sigma-B factor